MTYFTYTTDSTETIRAIRTHVGSKRHHHTHVGTNERFDSLHAAVILGKWPEFEKEFKDRAYNGARYSKLLKDIFVTPNLAEGNTHVYAQYTIRVNSERRYQIRKE